MKRLILTITVLSSFILLITIYKTSDKAQGITVVEIKGNQEPSKKLSKYDRTDLAIQQEFNKTKNPSTGKVEREKLLLAYKLAQKTQNNKATIPNTNWVERGPNNVGGRTRTILYDANDGTGKTVFAAGVAGGLWKTTDITAISPNWTAVNDFFDNLAIITIAQDPSTPQTMYFGTGEGFFNSDAIRGDGIWKSTDGGATWTQLGSTTGNAFDYVQKIVITSTGTVIAATKSIFSNVGGIQRSTDGGTSWTEVETGATALDWAADIEIAANGDLFSSFGIGFTDGIYKSTNDGLTWTRVFTAAAGEQRIELATAPNDANYIYGLVEGAGNAISRVIGSTNGGGAWSTLTAPSWSDQCSAGTADFTRGQAFYDLAIAVDPNDKLHVIIGGVDLLKTTNGGTSWTQITEWANCSGLADIHADQHNLTFKPGSSSELLVGNDGGVYRSTNANNATPSFSNKNTDYNVTQFYSCAMHPDLASNHFLAGAQDNGSQKFSTAGMNSTIEVTGGDGAYCHIDQNESQYQFTSYVYNQYRRSTDGGASFTNVNLSSNTGKFINPTDYDNDANILYASFSSGNYLRWTDPQTGTTAAAVGGGFSGQVSAVTCDPNTANRVWFGTDDGSVYQVNNAHSGQTINNRTSGSFPAGYVSCIEIENGDATHVVVTFSSYGVNSVWETTNSGTSWTSIEGNLPDMPIRWALFNPNDNTQMLLATEVGVWSTDNINAGSTNWAASNTGLANSRVDMLQYRTSDDLVLAATHGRGCFTSDVFTTVRADFGADKNLDYLANNIQFTDASYKATSWLWDFGDGNTSTAQNPSYAYLTAGQFTVTLTINGGAAVEAKANYIHILPNEGTPYTPADGGNFEANPLDFGSKALTGTTNLWERGAPTNAVTTLNSNSNGWKTDLDANVPISDIQCAFYTPSYNFSAAATPSYILQFRMGMEIEFCNGPLGTQVQYTTDKGATWTRLGTDDGAGTNWYNRGLSSGCQLHTSVTSDEIGWATNATNTLTNRDVSFLAGNPDVGFRVVLYVSSLFSGSPTSYRDGFMVDDFEIIGPVNGVTPLPVKLVSFSGEKKANHNLLKWSTTTEINNDIFQIERSIDAKIFKAIGEIEGAGNSTKNKQYKFSDYNINSIEKTFYYRLKQIDYNGKYEYSNIIAINNEKDITISSLYPNPIINTLNIRLSESSGKKIKVRIFGTNGRLFLDNYISPSDNNTFSINNINFPSGIYFVELTINNNIIIKKVIKN